MKYIFRAIKHEAISYLIFFGVLAAISGVLFGMHVLLGDSVILVILLGIFAGCQWSIVASRARYEKQIDRGEK